MRHQIRSTCQLRPERVLSALAAARGAVSDAKSLAARLELAEKAVDRHLAVLTAVDLVIVTDQDADLYDTASAIADEPVRG